MKTDEAILNILKEQIRTYKILHDLLKKERAHLIKINAEKVEEISKEKDTVVMKLRLLEEERLRLMKRYAEEKHVSSDINLRELGELSGNTHFPELRSQLISLLQGIEEMNKFNSILIERSINHIRSTANFFSLFKSESIPHATGVLLSRET